MKQMILLVVLFMTVAVSSVHANDDENVSRRALKAFNEKFPNARFAKWNELKSSDIYEVTFIYNNERLIGFIGLDGEVIAFARNAMNERLPFVVNETLQKKYAGFRMVSAEELIIDGDVSYLFLMENEKTKVHVRIGTTGEYSLIKRIKK